MFEIFFAILVRLIQSEDVFCDLSNDSTIHHITLDNSNYNYYDDYNDPEMVCALFELLDQADFENGVYFFPDFAVTLHYTSEDP